MGIIVSVAPGLGKSYLQNHPEILPEYSRVDFETANKKYDQKDPNWTDFFVKDALEATKENDFVFVPQQPAVMEALNKARAEWIRVVPTVDKIPEVIDGIRERDNSHVLISGNYATVEDFINKMEQNLYKFFTDEALANPKHQPTKLLKIEKGNWLSNHLERLYERYVAPKKEREEREFHSDLF